MKKLILLLVTWGISLLILGFLDGPKRLHVEDIPAMGPLLSPSTGLWQNSHALSSDEAWEFPASVTDPDALIIRDEHHIPHLFANNDLDGYRLQGFVEAVDRYWQMDFITRATAGRLSEIFGDKALEYDRKQRRKGILVAAHRTLDKWKTFEGSYSSLLAYTEGINDYVNQLDRSNYPIEYKILGYKPEPWTPLKTALFFKYMSDVLCARESDFEMYNVQKILGEKHYTYFFDRYNPHDVPVIREPKDTSWYVDVRDSIPKKIKEMGWAPQRPYDLPPSGLGSNNWAIAPQRSQSGNALFANDPHLPLKLPSIWYLSHICTPEQNVQGVSFPGTPGITLGFNENLAWGVTNVGHDVLDWLKIDWDGTSKIIQAGSDTLGVRWKYDTILVLNQDPFIDSTAWTRLGPIWTLPSVDGDQKVLMRWLGHEAGDLDDLSVFMDINHAQNLEEFLSAVRDFETPASNFAVATRDGDIALRVQGTLPKRYKGAGKVLTTLENDRPGWNGFIPLDQNPYSENPSLGFVSSANQVSTDTTYPYPYIIGDRRSERGRTINKMLDSQNLFNRQDMRDLQMNTYHISADDFIEATADFLETKGTEGQSLLQWDKHFEMEAEEPTLWTLWYQEFEAALWDELDVDVDVIYPGIWVMVDLLSNHEEHDIYDIKSTPDKVENRLDILEMSWQKALAKMADLEDKRWYKYRGTTIPHLIAPMTPFGIPEVAAGGTSKSPLALTSVVGPSWRLVHEPAGNDPAWGIYPGGQSGHPGSEHYMDFFEKWRTGQYLDLPLFEKPEQITQVESVSQNPSK